MRVMNAAEPTASTSSVAQVDVEPATSDLLKYTNQMLQNPPRTLAADDFAAQDDASSKAEDDNLISSILAHNAQNAPVDAVPPPSTA